MASKSSNPSSSFDPRYTIIADDLTSTMAPVRSKSRGGRLRSLGSISSRNTYSKKSSSKSAFYSNVKSIVTPSSSFKTRDQNEPLQEPLVLEIVPQEFYFVFECEA